MPGVIHCRVRGCKSYKKVKNAQEGLDWLWSHRKERHPAKFRESVKKSQETRGLR